jgi:hypothetical protein
VTVEDMRGRGNTALGSLTAPLGGWVTLALIATAVLLAVYARWLEPTRPGVLTPEGFYGFWDQSQYLRETTILAGGRLPADAGEYAYGLGYPALAVPFYLAGFRGDPFAPVDVVAFGLVIAGTGIVGARFMGERTGLVAALLLAVGSPVLSLMTIPWNATPVTAAFVVALVVVTKPQRGTVPDGVVIGLAAGLAFAARYVDVLPFLVVAVWWLARHRRNDFLRMSLAVVVPAAILLGAVLYTHQHAFGSVTTTPYASHLRPDGTSDQSLGQYDFGRVPRHTWEVVVSGTAAGKREPRDPLLRIAPYLVLMPIGLAVLLGRRGPWRSLNGSLLATSVVMTVFYLSFIAGGGGDLKFGNLRYWQVWYPWWTILSVAGGFAAFGPVKRATTRALSRE